MTTGMKPKKPELESLSVSQARQQFSETLNRVYRGETRVIVEKNGIQMGAIVSPGDIQTLRRIDRERAQGWDAVERMRKAFADVPDDELEREVEKAIAEVKAEKRQTSSEHESMPASR